MRVVIANEKSSGSSSGFCCRALPNNAPQRDGLLQRAAADGSFSHLRAEIVAAIVFLRIDFVSPSLNLVKGRSRQAQGSPTD